MKRRLKFLIAAAGILITCFAGVSQEAELTKTEALNFLSQKAMELCKDIPIEGEGTNVVLTGAAKIELDKLIKKFVDLNVEGAAKYTSDEYKGVLQEDLANVLKDSTDCKLEVLKLFHDDFFPKDGSAIKQPSKPVAAAPKYTFLGVSTGMSVVEAQERLPALELENHDATYWLVAHSKFKDDDATYYFRVSQNNEQRINGYLLGVNGPSWGQSQL